MKRPWPSAMCDDIETNRGLGTTMLRSFLLAAAVLSLTSCHGTYYGFHQDPFPVKVETVDVAQTAVFSVMVSGGIPVNGVSHVDGVKSPWAKAGFPMWVRVTPGSHSFVVQHTQWFGTRYRLTDIELSMENMLPRHVYLLIVHDQGDQITYETKDLGESPDYGITLGKGANVRYHRVAF